MASLNAYFAQRELEIPPSKRKRYKNLKDVANIQWHRRMKKSNNICYSLKSNTGKCKHREAQRSRFCKCVLFIFFRSSPVFCWLCCMCYKYGPGIWWTLVSVEFRSLLENKLNKEFHTRRQDQGRGQRLPKNSYLDQPTKSDVTSGLNYAAQLVSQSEKMAFQLRKIFCYLQTIRFVFFQTDGRKMFQAHFFDFSSKTFGNREQGGLAARPETEFLWSPQLRNLAERDLVLVSWKRNIADFRAESVCKDLWTCCVFHFQTSKVKFQFKPYI